MSQEERNLWAYLTKKVEMRTLWGRTINGSILWNELLETHTLSQGNGRKFCHCLGIWVKKKKKISMESERLDFTCFMGYKNDQTNKFVEKIAISQLASVRAKLLQSCLILCDPMDCSRTGSSVHGIFQARILEWVAISFSRGSSLPRDQTCIS